MAITKLGEVFLLLLTCFPACKFNLSSRKHKRKKCLILVWCHFSVRLALHSDHFLLHCPFSPTPAEQAFLTWLSISLMTRRTGLSRDADLRYRVFRLVPCSSVLYASRQGYPCTRAGKRRASWATNRGKWLHIWQVGSQVVYKTVPLLQGLLSQKTAVKRAADASSFTSPLHACGLVLSPTVCIHITCERYFKTGTPSLSTERVASPQDHNLNSRVAKHKNKLSRWASTAANRTLHKDTPTY